MVYLNSISFATKNDTLLAKRSVIFGLIIFMLKPKKKCSKCCIISTDFYCDNSTKDGLQSVCKLCKNKESLRYNETKIGVVSRIYYNQIIHSKKRGHLEPKYSRKELIFWCLTQTLFHTLYSAWRLSGYKKDLKPSCDRTDDSKSYSLNRLQLMTWSENNKKGNDKCMRAVCQMNLYGEEIASFKSMHSASELTRTARSAISGCCLGKSKTANGYKWKYSN